MKHIIISVSAILAAILCTTAFAGSHESMTSLSISSVPVSATANLDGDPCGITPLEINGISPGKHLLRISKQGFHDSFLTVDAAAGVENAVEVPLDPICASVVISSEPPDAGVSMDDVYLGVTPLLVPDVQMGKHRLSFGKQGFQNRVIEFTVSTPVPQQQSVTLVSDSATLVIESSPVANVMMNGATRGITPIEIGKIPPGTAEISLTANGYESIKQAIPLAAGDMQKLTFNLTPLPADLTIVTVPAGVRVYVNDQYKGDSPLSLKGLASGTYRVRTDSPIHEPMARNVVLRNAADVTEEFRLVPNCGHLRVVTAPAGVTVLVDGKSVGETTFNPDKSDALSDPMVVTNIAVGKRSLTFTKSGYYEEKRSAEIERDKEFTVDVTLKRKFIPDYEIHTASGVYKGVLIGVSSDFVRIETEIGVTRAFPIKDIIRRAPLKHGKTVLDAEPPKNK